jgi:predicted dehydrogenase
MINKNDRGTVKTPIRVGIIGCGNIGSFHARVLQETEGAVLAAVADTNPALASALAEQYGCRSFAGHRAMLDWGELDLVSVCLPPALHGQTALDAARAGKHILMEKPLDISAASADRIIGECRRLGVKLGTVSQHRFEPVIRVLEGLISGGRMGRLMMGSARVLWYRAPEYYQSGGGWRGMKSNQGGVLMSQAIHYIDLLQYLMGGVAEVNALCRTLLHKDIEVEDTGLVLLRFKNGAVGSIEATTIAYPGLMAELNLYSENTTVRILNDKLDFYAGKEGPVPELENLLMEGKNGDAAAKDPMTLETAPHRDQYLDMIDAILHDREPRVNGREGRAPLALIEAIFRSAENGTWAPVEPAL